MKNFIVAFERTFKIIFEILLQIFHIKLYKSQIFWLKAMSILD